MSEVKWFDPILNKRWNFHYPVLISTPNGETIKNISIKKYVQPIDSTELVELSKDIIKQPKIIIFKLNEEENLKRSKLGPKESKYYLNLVQGSVTKVKLGEDKYKLRDVLDTVTSNRSDRHYSSFVVSTAISTVQIEYLYSAVLDVEMSDGNHHEVYLRYITPTPKVSFQHKDAANKILKMFYETMRNHGSMTDEEMIDSIVTQAKAIYPDFGTTFKMAEYKTKNNGKEKKYQSKKRRRKQIGDTNDEYVHPKRTLVSVNAYIQNEIEFAPLESFFFVIIEGVDRNRSWLFDNIDTNLPATLLFEYDTPKELTNSPNLYKNQKYNDIITQAYNYAYQNNSAILWFKMTDVDIFSDVGENGEKFHIRFTMKDEESGLYVNVSTNEIEANTSWKFLEQKIITGLYNFKEGNLNTDLQSILDPAVIEEEFTIFKQVAENDPELDKLISSPFPVDDNVADGDIDPFKFDDDMFDLIDDKDPMYNDEELQKVIDETIQAKPEKKKVKRYGRVIDDLVEFEYVTDDEDDVKKVDVVVEKDDKKDTVDVVVEEVEEKDVIDDLVDEIINSDTGNDNQDQPENTVIDDLTENVGEEKPSESVDYSEEDIDELMKVLDGVDVGTENANEVDVFEQEPDNSDSTTTPQVNSFNEEQIDSNVNTDVFDEREQHREVFYDAYGEEVDEHGNYV